MEKLFEPHHNLSDEINRNIIRSEIEGGVDLRRLPHQATLEVATQNHRYVLVMERDNNAESKAWIAGHPRFCPEPVLVQISGSNWGGSMIKSNYLGRGMHMEFRHPEFPGVIVTSPIIDIRVLSEAA
jgi:hypothetical protein